MNPSALDQAKKEFLTDTVDEVLLKQCIEQADGDRERAQQMYLHRRAAEISPAVEDLDLAGKMAHAWATYHTVLSWHNRCSPLAFFL